MKHILLLSFYFLFYVCGAGSQNVELLWQNEEIEIPQKTNVFEYIDFKMDLTDIDTKIAEYKLTINKQGKNNLSSVFDKFWKDANDNGANAFSVEDVYFEDNKYIVLANVYYFDEALMDENFSYYEENTILIFGDLNTKNEGKPKTIKIDKQKQEIYPYQYKKIQNEPAKKVKISIGGVTGSSVTIVGQPDKFPTFLSLGGFKAMPAGGSLAVGTGRGGSGVGVGVGIQFKTGSIYPMNLNFGHFLMTIFYTLENAETE